MMPWLFGILIITVLLLCLAACGLVISVQRVHLESMRVSLEYAMKSAKAGQEQEK